jgi:UDP:flavonoid glycosyltransferase YjiC (YdhE family)
MAKALLLVCRSTGTNPSLPRVVRRETGRLFSGDAFADGIHERAHDIVGIRSSRDLRQLSERTDEMAWLLTRTTGEVLARHLDAFRVERADYIISDSVAPWGQWVAQILDLPVVTSVTTFAVNRHVLLYAASRGTRPRSVRLALSKIRHVGKAAMLGRRLRRQYGALGTGIMGLMFGSSDLNIVYTSRHFQPCAESFDDRFQFIGPSVDLRSAPASVPSDETAETDVICHVAGRCSMPIRRSIEPA